MLKLFFLFDSVPRCTPAFELFTRVIFMQKLVLLLFHFELLLPGKKLVQFSLPDRMCVFNESLQVLETFPLTVLDLSNFVNLDDGCVPSICKVTR